jgi:hypothetical protein
MVPIALNALVAELEHPRDAFVFSLSEGRGFKVAGRAGWPSMEVPLCLLGEVMLD